MFKCVSDRMTVYQRLILAARRQNNQNKLADTPSAPYRHLIEVLFLLF